MCIRDRSCSSRAWSEQWKWRWWRLFWYRGMGGYNSHNRKVSRQCTDRYLKQETVSGNGISWAVCKAVPCSRRITMHPTTQFLQAGCPSCRPTNSVKALKEQKFTCFVSTFTKSNGRCISTLIYPASCHLQCILSSRSATVCNWSQHTYAHERTHRQTDRETKTGRPT